MGFDMMRSNGSIRRRLAAGLMVTAGCLPVAAAHGENLIEVYALAKESDPVFRAARFDYEAATYAEPQAFAGFLPTISFEMTQTDTQQKIISSKNTVYSSGSSRYPTENRTVTINQPIFKLSSWRGYEQAKAKVRQASSLFGAAQQDLALRTATAYLNVLAASDNLTFTRAERDAIKRQLDLVQQRYASGLVAIASLHDAKARHAMKEADVIAAENELEDMQQALRSLTGKRVAGLRPVRDEIALEIPEPADIDKWVESAMNQNVSLEARRQAVEVAQQEAEKQRSAHVPVVDLVATNNRKNTHGSLFGGGSDVETTDVMVRLSVPIYSGGLTSALTGEAVKRHQSALEDLDRDGRQVERQTRAAYMGVLGGVARIKALVQSVVSQESARRLKAEGFKSGLETILAVLDAERDLYAAKRDSAKARYEFLLNKLRLKQAVGSLNEGDLASINGQLD